ncbi:MAG: NAD(+)/NADH kinase [Planctomycetaceae bacterium]|nr:NAD(+)/NADH kinase [Planctomycetaceae bacterium]
MSADPLRLLILARDQSARVQSALADVQRVLDEMQGLEVVGVATTKDPGPEVKDAVLAVVLGGDGAILRACRQFGTHQLPILGINLGRLGFLADLSPKELEENLTLVRDRKFSIVEHLMFECEHLHADGSSETYLGLNEVVVSSAGSLSMLDVELSIGDEVVTTYSGDGLIISTPVGSTAHSLSAGGPILRQDLQAFVVTPICPHTLTNRPLVDRADVEYTMSVPHVDDGVMLVIDGQIKQPVLPEDQVVVRRADVSFQLAKLPRHTYYATLHRKLGWSGQPRYRRPRK